MMASGPRIQYGWVIDEDKLDDDFRSNGVGIMGPRDLDPELRRRLDHGVGARFRLRDDDDEVYYVGRIVWTGNTTDVDSFPEEVAFAPLDDYGTPNAGCTSIEYFHPASHTWLAI